MAGGRDGALAAGQLARHDAIAAVCRGARARMAAAGVTGVSWARQQTDGMELEEEMRR